MSRSGAPSSREQITIIVMTPITKLFVSIKFNLDLFACMEEKIQITIPIPIALYQVATEFIGSSWTGSSVVEQMSANGMVVISSLAGSVGFLTVLVA